MTTAVDRQSRNAWMRHERMNGATIRQIAKRHGLSKSQVHRITSDCEILPPHPVPIYQLVPAPGGGYRHEITYCQPRQRAYKVRDHRRLYSGIA